MKKRLKDRSNGKAPLEQLTESEPERSPAAEIPGSKIAGEVRANFGNLVSDLHSVIDGFDDEELLRLGKESAPYKEIVKLVELRDGFFAVKQYIPGQDNPDELVADFNKAVKAAWQKLGEKWDKAVRLFPELAESLSSEWGNIKIESDRTPFQIELEDLKKSLDQARQLRAQIAATLEINPLDETAQAAIAELDAAFEIGKRRMSRLSAQTFRQLVVDIYEELNEAIENTGDKELIQSMADGYAAERIRLYANLLAQSAQSLRNLDAGDKPEEIIAIFNRTVVEARKKLKERRALAEKRHPRLKKEYPMDESYDKALANLVEIIGTRDELAESVKTAAPEKRSEGLRLIQQLDKQIEKSEQILAVEYEAFQNHARAVDALRDEVKLAGDEELRLLREYLKENPGEMKDLQNLLAAEFPE